MARELLRVSPFAPLAAAILIENDWWEDVEPKAAGWEKAFARHPTVQLALGQRYAKMKKYDDAERCLRATIELSPEYRAYQALADVYAARGRFDRWQETLDAYLKQEDIGLDHARVRVEIANALMARGDFRRRGRTRRPPARRGPNGPCDAPRIVPRPWAIGIGPRCGSAGSPSGTRAPWSGTAGATGPAAATSTAARRETLGSLRDEPQPAPRGRLHALSGR